MIMAKFYGAQRMVLQAILDAQGDTTNYIEDSRLVQNTRLILGDLRNWLETLEGDEYINLARTEAGLSASITAKGRVTLAQTRPFPSQPTGPLTSTTLVSHADEEKQVMRTILLLAANPKGTQPLRTKRLSTLGICSKEQDRSHHLFLLISMGNQSGRG